MHNKPGARKKFDLICDFCFIFPGKQVGRVPANLCRAFRMITERQLCTELTFVYNNSFGVSREPRPDQSFERRFSAGSITLDRDLPGGGAELQCSYIITVQSRYFKEMMRILEQHVGVDVLDSKLFA